MVQITQVVPLKYPFSHTHWQLERLDTGKRAITRWKRWFKWLLQLLYTCIYAEFMHFVFFVKLYPICPCMNRHFRNMHSHLVDLCSRFSLTAQGSFLEYFLNASAWQSSWVVQLFYFIIDDILVACICDGTYNSWTCWCTGWLKIKFDLRSGSHALHIDIIHLPVFVKHRHCGVSFFVLTATTDPLYSTINIKTIIRPQA